MDQSNDGYEQAKPVCEDCFHPAHGDDECPECECPQADDLDRADEKLRQRP